MSDGVQVSVDGQGRKDCIGKPAMDCIPPQPLIVLGKVYSFGADKYDRHNWLRGYEWTKSYEALQRHILAWYSGEDTDPESHLPHLGHAMWHIVTLLYWSLKPKVYGRFDNRPFKEGASEEAAGSADAR